MRSDAMYAVEEQVVSVQPAVPCDDPTDCAIDAYLDALGRAQVDFLDAIADAGASIPAGTGRLTEVVAQHYRLSQQFLDGQRAIVRRRSEADARVARLDQEAPISDEASDAAATPFSVTGDLAATSDRLTQRHELSTLLDGWWHAENDRCAAEIDDAETRLAIRTYLRDGGISTESAAAVSATVTDRRSMLTTHADAIGTETPSVLPAALRDALEAADDDGLSSTIDLLLIDLGHADVSVDEHREDDDAGLLAGLLGDAGSDDVEPPSDPADEAFDRFWTHLTRRPERRGVRRVFSMAMSGASVAGVAAVVTVLIGK